MVSLRYTNFMGDVDHIHPDPAIMGGKPCAKGARVTVGTIVGLFAVGHDMRRILELYPYLTEADVRQAAQYLRQ